MQSCLWREACYVPSNLPCCTRGCLLQVWSSSGSISMTWEFLLGENLHNNKTLGWRGYRLELRMRCLGGVLGLLLPCLWFGLLAVVCVLAPLLSRVDGGCQSPGVEQDVFSGEQLVLFPQRDWG